MALNFCSRTKLLFFCLPEFQIETQTQTFYLFVYHKLLELIFVKSGAEFHSRDLTSTFQNLFLLSQNISFLNQTETQPKHFFVLVYYQVARS